MAPERAAETASALEPEGRYVIGPGPGLRLVQTWKPPSTAKRRFFATVLALPAWAIAFPGPLDEPSSGAQILLWAVAYLLWIFPTDHLFVAPERIRGMLRVAREVWLRPAERPGEPASIVVDGNEAGSARDAEVWIYAIDVLRAAGRYTSAYKREYDLALVTSGTIHLLDHDRAADVPRRAAQALLQGLERPGATVHERSVGKEPWSPYALSAALFVAGLVPVWSPILSHVRVPPGHAHPVALGLCALAVRAAVTVDRFSRANGQLLDARAFAKRFPGALPAVPPLRWLTPRTGRMILWTTIAMLAASVASLVVGPR